MSDESEEIKHVVQGYLVNITRKYNQLGNGSSPEEEETKTEVCFSERKTYYPSITIWQLS